MRFKVLNVKIQKVSKRLQRCEISDVRSQIGSSWVISELESDTAVRASAQVTLTKHVPTYIEVQYKHSVGTWK